MIITNEIKAVIEHSAFIAIGTVNEDNTAHPIVVGGGKVVDDTVVFGIYKMEITQENLSKRNSMWMLAAILGESPKGFRLTGTAKVNDKELVFSVEKAEAMI